MYIYELIPHLKSSTTNSFIGSQTINKKSKVNMALTTAPHSYPSTFHNVTLDQNTTVSYTSAGEFLSR